MPENPSDTQPETPAPSSLWRIGARPARKPLPPELELLAEKELQIHLDLLASHKHIRDRAAAGEPISADDYHCAEETFNARFDALKEEVAREIKEKVRRDMAASGDAGEGGSLWEKVSRTVAGAFRASAAERRQRMEYEHDVEERIYDTMYPSRTGAAEENPVVAALENTAPIDAAFRKQYVETSSRRKNTRLDASTDTKEKLLIDLLSKNRGIAIGECHDQQEATQLMSDNMAALKAAGVDSFYIESPDDQFQAVSRMSPEQLRRLARDRTYTDDQGKIHILPNPDMYRDEHGRPLYDDVCKSTIEFLIAAREHGIRVVNIDKKGRVREFEESDHRVASTNFIWTDNIEKDRAALAEQGKPEGKFVVWGGQGHFLNERKYSGLVDEGLGIPVIAFVRGNERNLPAFAKGLSANGADFYLPGGGDHYDTFKSVAAKDVQDAAERLKNSPHVPGFIPGGLEWVSEKLENAADKSWIYRPVDVPEAGEIPAPPATAGGVPSFKTPSR